MNQILGDYFRQQQYQPGWQDLSALMFSGILQTAENEAGRAFIHMMGTHLAQRYPLTEVTTLGCLEDKANAVLMHFNWGVVQINSDPQGMNIRHFGWPAAPTNTDAEQWMAGFSALLEGCWNTWLATLGGGQDNTVFTTYGNNQSLNFRYQSRAAEDEK